MHTPFFKQYQRHYDTVVNWRRYLHQYPELSFHETKTAQFITDKLRSFGIENIRTHVGGNGIVATIHGAHPGLTLAYRADFDALPIQDAKETSYKSTIDGVAHACGHDGHTANLLAVAKILHDMREQLHGNVVLLFQHAEEKPPGGALDMVKDGALDGVDYVFGGHLASDIPLGKIATRSGPMMASVDKFIVHLKGRGGHGGRPHQTIDCITIGSQFITHLQQIVSRRVNPIEPAVVTVGSFHAGNAFNIIADSAYIEGTVRTMSSDVRAQIERQFRALLDSLKMSDGIDYTLDYENGYPVLVNHDKEAQIVQSLVRPDDFIVKEIALGADDFAYFLQERPGAYFFVGSATDDPATQYPHHHPRFDFDERALLNLGEMFLKLTSHYLLT